MFTIPNTLTRTAALALFVSGIAMAAPAFAASPEQYAPADAQNNAPAAPAAKTAMKHHKPMMTAMTLETRIKTLHDKLKITDDQEAEWATVAQTMRDNETNIHQLVTARHQNPENMTAVDDLQSYQQITQAHADGLQKLTTAFSTLYNDMSDDQKANADTVFGKFEGHRG